MKILIRADASKDIGTGHIMRCMTLASELRLRGYQITFVMRDPDHGISQKIRLAGHDTRSIYTIKPDHPEQMRSLNQGIWLPVSQEVDASETLGVICETQPDLVVVDHYALDVTWHQLVKPQCKKIMVIDDLGDRRLLCDVLLDQNLGASYAKYTEKIVADCNFLFGPKFALLRKEFLEWRQTSLERRTNSLVKNVLVSMGGVDMLNYSLAVMKELSKSIHAKNCKFTIILGTHYPHKPKLLNFIRSSDLDVCILYNVTNMAEIMSKSDLCIGAAGTTSWERCALGLPTITLAIADNQHNTALTLHEKRLAIFSELPKLKFDFECFFENSGAKLLNEFSWNMRAICDGLGANRVADFLERI